MMQVKGGEFSPWYNSLSDKEKLEYHLQIESLQIQFKNRKIKREKNGLRQNI